MLKKVFTLLILAFSLVGNNAEASHLMGGEISWVCQPNGKFVFTVIVYRDCGGSTLSGNQSVNIYNGASQTSYPLTRISQLDVSPTCFDPNQQLTCANGDNGAIEEHTFVSAEIQLNGVPPATGIWITWESFARNGAISNLNSPGGTGFTLRAAMFPYNGQNLFPCYDNSPVFLEKPSTVLCTGYPFTYNNNGQDPDFDSLVYSWAEPLDQPNAGMFNPPAGNPPTVSWAAGFSATNPMPDASIDPRNEGATIDPITGNVSYTSFTSGFYVTCLKAEAYRCGIKIAEVARDIQVVLYGNCPSNNPPNVDPPFQNPTTGLYTEYVDTVYAGQTARFTLAGTDFDFLPTGAPQEMTILATGSQFGAGYTDPLTGCDQPPCATLNPPPPVTASIGVSTDFEWVTDCANLERNTGCGQTSNTYSFVMRVKDNACTAPAIKFTTVTIVVLTLPVDPPKLRCITPINNGTAIELDWTAPIDTGGFFDSYHLFYGPTYKGPFTVIDSLFDLTQESYIKNGVNSGYFFIRARNNCGVLTTPSDTVGIMELSAQNPVNANAELNWTTFSREFAGTSYQRYEVRREYPAGVWNVIAGVQDTFYTDTLVLCDADVNYQIAVVDSSGCQNLSSIQQLHFEDVTAPAISSMEFVTVDPTTNNAVINYSAITTPDAIGYIIYRNFQGNWVAIDTVYDLSQTTYVNDFSIADQEAEQYRVASIDSCNNVSPLNVEHATIFLRKTLRPCLGINELDFTDYINWGSGVASYTVYVSEDGAPYTVLGVLAPGTNSINHNNLQRNSVYCYYVEAIDNDGLLTSSSNLHCQKAGLPRPSDYDYMESASVFHQEEYIEVKNVVDSLASVISYRIERGTDGPVNYEILGFVDAGEQFINFKDYTADFEKHSYYYRAIAVDTCGNDEDTSNLGRTILLEAEGASDMTNRLTWNQAGNWDQGVERYEVFRAVSGVWDTIPAAIIMGGDPLIYLDNVSAFSSSSGSFKYRIVAYENAGNQFNVLGKSTSNEADAKQAPRIYIPNSFTPGGRNPIFKPSASFTDSQYYEFSIIDRWGKEMFFTTDPSEGWDGLDSKGRNVPLGVYVYRLRSQTLYGTEILKHGTVTLIR